MDRGIKCTREGNLAKLELSDGGEAVARLTIVDSEMRLLKTWLRMGGLASVRTNPAHRGKGYGRRLLLGTLDYMREEGYLVSTLFGIPDFYSNFGYATVLPRKSVVSVRTGAAEMLPGALGVREAGPADAAALLDIYHEANAERNGPLKRSKSSFSQWPDKADDWFQEPRRILVAEENGVPVAYVVGEQRWRAESKWGVRPHEIAVARAGAARAASSLIRALAQEAAQQRCEWLKFEMLPDSPLVAVLRQVGFSHEIEYSHDQGGMGRIIDLAGLAEALTETLATRNLALNESLRLGKLSFVCEDEQAEVVLGVGRTVAIALPQHALLQLLMGYRGIHELRLEHPTCVEQQDVAPVDALLPQGYPYMWNNDHF